MTQVPDIVFLKAFNKAWNDHDIEALMSFMADDCSFHAVGGPDLLGKSFMGRDAVREGFQLAWRTFPDAAWIDGDHFVVGDRGVSESTFVGTKPDGTPRKLLDVSRLADLGWRYAISLEQGLAKTYQWFLANQDNFRK